MNATAVEMTHEEKLQYMATVIKKWDGLSPINRMTQFGYSNCPTVRKTFEEMTPAERQSVMEAAEHTVPMPRRAPEKPSKKYRD